MIETVWRRVGPWLTPVLVLVELVLVLSGVLALGNAIVIVVVVEALLAVTVVARVVAMVRRYRTERAGHRDGWRAAEEGLAQLMPRGAARALMYEVRIWACLCRWPSRPHRHPADGYHYVRSLRPLLLAVLAMLVFEAAVIEVVLAVILGDSPWVWVGLALHLYALVWLGGLLGSLHVRPHLVGPDGLRLRDGVCTELTIPYDALAAVRTVRRQNLGRSGLKIDSARGTAVLAHGQITALLELHPHSELFRDDAAFASTFTELAITVDDPDGFRSAIASRRAELSPLE